MCGIFGVVNKEINKNKFDSSLNLLSHRGPDNINRSYFEKFAFGHTRLSIQDLSQTGNQPMFDDQKNCIIYNGEIYNFKILREKLKQRNNTFNTQTDTEVILKSISSYGLQESLKLFRGMFSFAYFNKKENKIFLVRDKYGMKPLYYTSNSKYGFIFSSEVKPINSFIDKVELDRKQLVISSFLGLHSYPFTNFKNIFEVKPGEILIYDLNSDKILSKNFFSLNEFIDEDYFKHLDNLNEKNMLIEYDKHFSNAVKMHLVSDAPTSIAYSAGLDSSLITRYACDYDSDIKCFFYNSNYKNFVKTAEIVKDDIQANLQIYNEKKYESIINLPKMVYFSENILNPTGSPLQSLTEFAKGSGVKSMLTGDAADELFGGYAQHATFYNKLLLSNNKIFMLFTKLLNNIMPGFHKYSEKIKNNYLSDYLNDREIMHISSDIILNNSSLFKNWTRNYSSFGFIKKDFEKKMQSYFLHYFQTNLKRYLFRSDISGMQNSVELRIPFLDDEFVKLALNTPVRFKMGYSLFNNYSSHTKLSFLKHKIILRKLAKFKGKINNVIINRKKTGIPMDYKFAQLLLSKIKTDNLAELFKMSKAELQNLINNNEYTYLNFSFLQTEIFLRIFQHNEKYDDISNEIKTLLYSLNK